MSSLLFSMNAKREEERQREDDFNQNYGTSTGASYSNKDPLVITSNANTRVNDARLSMLSRLIKDENFKKGITNINESRIANINESIKENMSIKNIANYTATYDEETLICDADEDENMYERENWPSSSSSASSEEFAEDEIKTNREKHQRDEVRDEGNKYTTKYIRTENDKVARIITKMNDTIESMNNKIDGMNEQIDYLSVSVDELNENLGEIQEEFDNYIQSTTEDMRKIKILVKKVKTKMNNMNNDSKLGDESMDVLNDMNVSLTKPKNDSTSLISNVLRVIADVGVLIFVGRIAKHYM